MDEPGFDEFLRRVAQHGTRREALGALLGGALLLGSARESAANDKAKRRKKRKKRLQAKSSELLPIQVTVKNPGPNMLDVQFVNLMHAWSLPLRWICINPARRVYIPENGEATFYTLPVPGSPVNRRSTDGFVWINEKYSIEFWNLLFHRPSVSAAVNGVSMNNRQHCPNRGTRALNDIGVAEGETLVFNIYDKSYMVERLPDTDHKVFVLTLPKNL